MTNDLESWLAKHRQLEADFLQRAATPGERLGASGENGPEKSGVGQELLPDPIIREIRSRHLKWGRERVAHGLSFETEPIRTLPRRTLRPPAKITLARLGLELPEPIPDFIPELNPRAFKKPLQLDSNPLLTPVDECVFDQLAPACSNTVAGSGEVSPPNYPADALSAQWDAAGCIARIHLAAACNGASVYLATGVGASSDSVTPVGDGRYCFMPVLDLLGQLSYAIPNSGPPSSVNVQIAVQMALYGTDPALDGWTFVEAYALDFADDTPGFRTLPIDLVSDEFSNDANGGPMTVEHELAAGTAVTAYISCACFMNLTGNAAASLDFKQHPDYGIRSWQLSWGAKRRRWRIAPSGLPRLYL